MSEGFMESFTINNNRERGAHRESITEQNK